MGAPSPPAAGAGTVDLSRWPLVGRDDELALARSALTEHGGVVLTGAAGVGKTRLAREVLGDAGAEGDRVVWVAATQAAATVPLGAVADLVPGASIGQGRDATLRAIVAALELETGGGRLLLGVDDAHLLDEASAALVHVLVTSGAGSAVVTLRSGETAPDAITALWKDGSAPLVALQTLARPEVERLVDGVLDGQVDGAALHTLWHSSQGNALFLRELVRDGIESGVLRCEDGLWRWRGAIEPGKRLQDIVAMRMGRLEDEERAALEVLAVGEPLTSESLVIVGIAEIAEALERRGLVTVARQGREREVSLAHPLFGEAVRASMPATRHDDVRRRLADALEAMAARGPSDVLRIGLWRADAGDNEHPEQLCAAARRAWVLGDAGAAERLARAALESAPELEAGYLLGEALSDQGRAREALEAWSAVEDLPGTDRVRASLAVARAGLLVYQLNDRPEAAATLRRAAARISDDDARRRLAGQLALFAATDPSADDVATATLRGARADESPLVPNAALAVTLELAGAGELERAIQTADLTIASEPALPEEQPTILELLGMTRAWAGMLRGEVIASEADAEQSYRETVQEGAEVARARWCLARGMFAIARGRPRTAIRVLKEATAVMEAAYMGFRRPAQAYLAMANALIDDVDAAHEHLRASDTANRSVDRIFAVDIARAHAWVEGARGELTAAAAAAEHASAQAADAGQWALEAWARHDVVRFGGGAGVAARLQELAGVVDGPLVGAFAVHAHALDADDGAALDQVSVTFDDLGFDLFAAEASAAAAAAYRRATKKASAFASTRRTHELAERCEGARTPALARVDQPDDLTAREQQVADLAASGLASKEIAGRLGIKARTVDNLLGRVYTKLGVSGRQDLAEWLGSGLERPHA
ncbi:MAG: LuxR C-terminal-related transcriptional regulator [Actinomycetota bacterium]